MPNKTKVEGASAPKADIKEEINNISQPMFVCPMTGLIFNTEEELKKHWSQYKKIEDGQAVINLEYQPYIPAPPGLPAPQAKEQMQKNYSRNDGITVKTWWKEWKRNKLSNLANFDVLKNTVMKEHCKFAYKPVIIAGSGPSLKKNAHLLAERGGVGLTSALHNFGYFESIGVKPDYYMNLDAGDITIAEIGEGDPKVWEKTSGMSHANRAAYLDKINYWEKTKDHTLITCIQANPELVKRWQGKIRWFDTPLAGMNEEVGQENPDIHKLRTLIQTGGNTLGACHYFAKVYLGCSQIVFVGADFCFSLDKKFHAWDSPYDDQYDGLMDATNVYGICVKTWASYFGFKNWFEHVAMGGISNVPGTYVNCTEGGILGAYPGGNIMQIRQRRLIEFMKEVNLHTSVPEAVNDKEKLNVFY